MLTASRVVRRTESLVAATFEPDDLAGRPVHRVLVESGWSRALQRASGSPGLGPSAPVTSHLSTLCLLGDRAQPWAQRPGILVEVSWDSRSTDRVPVRGCRPLDLAIRVDGNDFAAVASPTPGAEYGPWDWECTLAGVPIRLRTGQRSTGAVRICGRDRPLPDALESAALDAYLAGRAAWLSLGRWPED